MKTKIKIVLMLVIASLLFAACEDVIVDPKLPVGPSLNDGGRDDQKPIK